MFLDSNDQPVTVGKIDRDNLIISPDLQPQQINKALERPNTTSILSGGSEEDDLTETTDNALETISNKLIPGIILQEGKTTIKDLNPCSQPQSEIITKKILQKILKLLEERGKESDKGSLELPLNKDQEEALRCSTFIAQSQMK